MIMTVDIGGTKTLATFWDEAGILEQKKFVTSQIADFTELVLDLAKGKDLDCICFALAGPVKDNCFELTNTGQKLYLDHLREDFPAILHMAFLNDLEALGYSVLSLEQDQLSLFRKGSACAGAKAVLSIGTGFGVSAVSREGVVLPSEGGHLDFAPQDSQQQCILNHLREKYGHVSYERLLSGQGLSNIYTCVAEDTVVSPRQVTERAFAKEPAALETMGIFSAILGTACSSYALIFLATGGIYLGGGIMPKILPLLDKERFENAYLEKGRLKSVIEQIPVFVILDENAPSLGAAIYGERLSSRF